MKGGGGESRLLSYDMTKALVETTGNFQLLCQQTAQLVPFNRPAVVEMSVFLTARAGLGQLRVLENMLSEEATDEALVNLIKQEKGDVSKGVERFCFKFKVKPRGDEV